MAPISAITPSAREIFDEPYARCVVPRATEALASLGIDVRPGSLPPARFWDAVVESSGQTGIGVRLAERYRVTDFGLLGHLVSNSATLGEALLHGLRLSRLSLSAAQLSVYIDGERTTVALELAAPDALHREEVEFIVTCGVLAARALTGKDFVPFEVSFTHDAPRDTSHQRRVLRAPLRFGAVQTSCSFATSLLLGALPSGDALLRASLVDKAEHRIAAQSAGLAQQVRSAILAELRHGEPSIKRVATRMGTYPRTLTRKLSATGISYRDLLARTRFELAEQHLGRPDSRVANIARLLGYSDKSAFNRAFKRQAGCSPQQFRERIHKAREQSSLRADQRCA